MSYKALGLTKYIILFIIICYVPFIFFLNHLPFLLFFMPCINEKICFLVLTLLIPLVFVFCYKGVQIILLYYLYKSIIKTDNTYIKTIFNKFSVALLVLLLCICIDYYINVWGNSPWYNSTPFNLRLKYPFDILAYNISYSLTSNFVVLYLISLFFKLKTFIKNKLHKNAD